MARNVIQRQLDAHASQGRAYIEATCKDMRVIYFEARERLNRKLTEYVLNKRTSLTGPRVVQLTHEIQREYAALEAQYREVFTDSIPYVAQGYYQSALTDLGTNGNQTISGSISKARIKTMTDDAFNHIAGATKSMQDNEIMQLRKLSAQIFRESALTGETRAEVSKRLLGKNLAGGNFRFIDKGNRRWEPSTYFDMLGRTVLHNTARSAYLDGCADSGNDVVRISISGNPCPNCAVWENRLLSISGKTPGLPTVAAATAAGLFHPNCTHRMIAVPDAIREAKYDENGRPITGINSEGREEKDDKEAWQKYRKGQSLVGHREGPLDKVLKPENVSMEPISAQWSNKMQEHIVNLHEKYDTNLETVRTFNKSGAEKAHVINGRKMAFNMQHFANKDEYIKNLKSEINARFKVKIDQEKYDLYTVTHEFGHTVFNEQFSMTAQITEMKMIRADYYRAMQKATPKEAENLFLSDYADCEKKLNEFFTEGFTQYILSSEPTPVAKAIGIFVEKHYRKK